MESKEEIRTKVWEKVNLATAALNQNNFLKALTILLDCNREFPEYSIVYNYLGWLHSCMEDFERAEYYYKLALTHEPVYPSVYVNYAILLNALNRAQDLEVIYRKAIQEESIRKDIINGEYGIMLEKQGRYDEAISAYQISIKSSMVVPDIEFYKNAIYRCELKKDILDKRF